MDINNKGRLAMNNLLLVGNGFDVAHRLHTSYDDFLTIMKFSLFKGLNLKTLNSLHQITLNLS